MGKNRERFVLSPTFGGTWMIRDSKDGSIVCIMQKFSRPLEKTEAMTKVILAALNDATRPQNVKNVDDCPKAES